MWYARNEKWEKINNGKNRTTNSKKNLNAWRKEKLQVLGDIESEHHRTSGNEIKIKKRVPQMNEKASRNQTLLQKFHQKDKPSGSPLYKLFETILKMEKGRTQINAPKNKEIHDYAKDPFIREMS